VKKADGRTPKRVSLAGKKSLLQLGGSRQFFGAGANREKKERISLKKGGSGLKIRRNNNVKGGVHE